MKSSYMSGIRKEDIPAAANSVTMAEHAKSINTSRGGYLSKQLLAVFQTAILDEPGSDCGSKGYLTITLTEDNLEDYVDQYLVDNDRLILITPDLPIKYLNRPVKLRSPMYCIGKTLCNKCAGERYYKLGVRNMGLGTNALGGQIQKSSLKLKHNAQITVDRINENTILK